MWRFKPFIQKEQAGLEGRAIDVGNLKIHVLNAIAEGGFSCVYMARDGVHQSKQYALKHIICNDEESLDLVKKEMSVMKALRGHPNIVTLAASDILDMGRKKEAFFVMEFCEKSLVNVLESRGMGYYEEKQVLLIFRDICNAVFTMHCQTPPIAHRDLKVENVLLGSDGAWKLCDFGSTSTNHKCFDRPEEMGIEEDNIRKHTTPAYRAPEMWDLLRREVISEKVDIWALGCLLYRICYFKLAFDGESKLQILNGNYRIPDLPKYSSSVIDLIKDMLQSPPESRPDITQVWFRVNLLLPEELQKQTPDSTHSMVMPDLQIPTGNVYDEGVSNRAPVLPRRSPPPPPSKGHVLYASSQSVKEDPQPRRASAGSVGMFWSTPHAQETQVVEDKTPVYDEEPNNHVSLKRSTPNPNYEKKISPPKEQRSRNGQLSGSTEYGNSSKRSDVGSLEDFEIRFDSSNDGVGKARDLYSEKQKTKASNPDPKMTFQNEAFNSFVAEFDTTKFNSGINNLKTSYSSGKSDLEAEVERLKEELKTASLEKAEITSKYEKLSAICRSQRQEIQELKQALAAASPSYPNNQGFSANLQSYPLQREKIEGTMSQPQQATSLSASVSSNPDLKTWKPFTEEPTAQPAVRSSHPKSVRTTSSRQISGQPTVGSSGDSWGFGQDSFTAVPTNSRLSKDTTQGSTSQRFQEREAKKVEAKQPAGWAGF